MHTSVFLNRYLVVSQFFAQTCPLYLHICLRVFACYMQYNQRHHSMKSVCMIVGPLSSAQRSALHLRCSLAGTSQVSVLIGQKIQLTG